jgi:hypothetical protein
MANSGLSSWAFSENTSFGRTRARPGRQGKAGKAGEASEAGTAGSKARDLGLTRAGSDQELVFTRNPSNELHVACAVQAFIIGALRLETNPLVDPPNWDPIAGALRLEANPLVDLPSRDPACACTVLIFPGALRLEIDPLVDPPNWDPGREKNLPVQAALRLCSGRSFLFLRLVELLVCPRGRTALLSAAALATVLAEAVAIACRCTAIPTAR